MDLPAGILTTKLSEMHRKVGAEMGAWFACELPDSFGDWQVEYQRLREGVGLLDKNYRAYLEFAGPDRVRYLNALLTNDIRRLEENHGNVSLFLSPQGHIQAEIEAYARKESVFCVSHAMVRERLIAGMDKYIIMDDVVLTDQTAAYGTLAVEGPKAAEVALAASGVELATLGELETRESRVGPIPCRVTKRSPRGIPGAEFLVDGDRVEELWDLLLEEVRRSGGGPSGYQALNAVRLETGTPWFGYDFGDKQIPHEAGLEDSHISYTKGCYTGQEIVERVRSRGQVNRVRVSFAVTGAVAPAPNAVLLADGKEAGWVTRSGFSPALRSWIGMGYVRREKSAPGSLLETGKERATVIATPLPAPG